MVDVGRYRQPPAHGRQRSVPRQAKVIFDGLFGAHGAVAHAVVVEVVEGRDAIGALAQRPDVECRDVPRPQPQPHRRREVAFVARPFAFLDAVGHKRRHQHQVGRGARPRASQACGRSRGVARGHRALGQVRPQARHGHVLRRAGRQPRCGGPARGGRGVELVLPVVFFYPAVGIFGAEVLVAVARKGVFGPVLHLPSWRGVVLAGSLHKQMPLVHPLVRLAVVEPDGAGQPSARVVAEGRGLHACARSQGVRCVHLGVPRPDVRIGAALGGGLLPVDQPERIDAVGAAVAGIGANHGVQELL